jgi:hypothetical protein
VRSAASSSRRLLLAVALLLAPEAVRGAEPDSSADQWCSRVAEALRVHVPMAGRAHMHVEGLHERDLDFSFDLLRQPGRDETRTVFEMRETGDSQSVVSELVVAPDEPMVNWYWDVQKRRWLSVKGLLPTDPFADTLFRHEDLWLTDPSARRSGTVREVEDQGRRYIELASEPYHYYQRVETRIDPETALPVRVRFIDNTGAPIREQVFESIEIVNGKPFPKVVRLRDLVGGAESVLTWERVEFDKRIPPSFLDLSVLHDRITKGIDPVPLDSLPEPRDPDGI